MITIPDHFVQTRLEDLEKILDKIVFTKVAVGISGHAYCSVADGCVFVGPKGGNLEDVEWKGNRVAGIVNDKGEVYVDPQYLQKTVDMHT